jgi:hypothetical protein
MNERINDLFGQALDQAVPETWTTLNPAQLSKLKEKFAELLVRECIANCNDLDSMKFIADHFEIKIPGLNDEPTSH